MLDFDRLKILLRETGVTKSSIAEKMRRNRSIFNDWEKGKSNPSEDQLEVVAQALGTTVAYLCGESDVKERKPLQTSDLTTGELELLKAFREADPALQRAALLVLKSGEDK